MKILYIPLGSFCHPKILLRESNREPLESLPFDFHSSPHLNGITNILKELYETCTYKLKFKEILNIHNHNANNESELTVSEENLYLLHFFKQTDLIFEIDENNKDNIQFPLNIDNIKEDKIIDIKILFHKRFERLYNLLNDTNNVLCFLRIENYDNREWKNELTDLTNILSKFKNPNKFIIYSQNLIDDNLHFNISRVLNYDFKIPIFFFKYYFYDVEMVTNKNLFLTMLDTFEYILNNKHTIIHIKQNNIIQKYYLKQDERHKNYKIYKIFKLTDINNFSKCYYDKEIGKIFIITVFKTFIFQKNNDNIFEEVNQ